MTSASILRTYHRGMANISPRNLSRDFLDNPTRDSSGRTIREIIED